MLIRLVYLFLIVFCLAAGYALLTAGHPESLLRMVVEDPAHDTYLAVGFSLVVFILGFVVFQGRDQANLRQLVEMNQERVRELRRKGESDQRIADAILVAMGSHTGYRHNLTRKKLVLLLARFR